MGLVQMRIVSKTGTLGRCAVAVVAGLSLKYDVQFHYMFLFSRIFFFMVSANGKIMALLSSDLCILLLLCLPLSLVMTVSPSDIFHFSPVTGLEWPRGFQEVKFPRFHDNGTGRW